VPPNCAIPVVCHQTVQYPVHLPQLLNEIRYVESRLRHFVLPKYPVESAMCSKLNESSSFEFTAGGYWWDVLHNVFCA
jgi:hypothetical protein